MKYNFEPPIELKIGKLKNNAMIKLITPHSDIKKVYKL